MLAAHYESAFILIYVFLSGVPVYLTGVCVSVYVAIQGYVCHSLQRKQASEMSSGLKWLINPCAWLVVACRDIQHVMTEQPDARAHARARADLRAATRLLLLRYKYTSLLIACIYDLSSNVFGWSQKWDSFLSNSKFECRYFIIPVK